MSTFKTANHQSKKISPVKVFSKLFFSFIGVVFIIIGIFMYVALQILPDYETTLTLLGLGSVYNQTQENFNSMSLIFLVIGIPFYLMGVLTSIYDNE